MAPLVGLRTLYWHMDLKGIPHPYALRNPWGEYEFRRNLELLQEAANTLAPELPVSVTTICLLQRKEQENLWVPFGISRTHDIVCAPYSPDLAGTQGVK